MKKLLLTFSVMLLSLSISAEDNTPGVIVNKTDGSTESIVIQRIRSIRFKDGNMIVNMKDNSQQTYGIDDITNMTFADIASAIKAIADDSTANGKLLITDMLGHIVYSGTTGEVPGEISLPSGIYVITANGKSHRVMIGGTGQ